MNNMNKTMHALSSLLLFAAVVAHPKLIHADTGRLTRPTPQSKTPYITPTQPKLNAKAYMLVDVNSGKILAEQDSEKKLPPASLTKMMTLYVVSKALHNEQIHLTDKVHISKSAWKTGGSRMFVKAGQDVAIEDLLKGIIVDSGNDACVAMAEHLGGSEQGFADLMNQEAKQLGMLNSHFTDSTGLPRQDLYTSAKDLAILARALVKDFPEYYHWYKQKWFTFNEIRQPNRNRLLWRDALVDGMKTGYTDKAGYCLAASAKKNDMRLISIVLGSPTDAARADDSERLLKYGFRFFETHRLYEAGKPLATLPLYKGVDSSLPIGLLKDQYVTIPTGQYQHLTIKTEASKYLQAPIEKGQKIGDLVISFNGEMLSTRPLYALKSVSQAGLFSRAQDSVALKFKQWFS
ncbi:MAG: D-alanyl-D-alanine carboxypeptidase family protein [Legionella sp.]|nr:D-alanyl-D-alanine carboxypeptidase family protein [Legionella sp.]